MILKLRAEIDRFLKSPGPQIRAALIHGRDLGVVRERARALAQVVTERPDDPFDVALLSESDVVSEPGKLEGELMAISMMGGRRLVRLRLDGERSGPDRAAAEALSDHLNGKLNPDAFFLIEAGGLVRDSQVKKVAEAGAGCVSIACWADEAGDLVRMTRDALMSEKVGLAADAMDLFVSRLPQERGVARQEIERLSLFLGPGSGKTATAAELAEFLGVEPEASLGESAIDAFGGRLGSAYTGLRRAAREGEAGPAAVRAISLHLAKLRRIAMLQQEGSSAAHAAKTSGVFWKNEREVLRQARVWTGAELDKMQDAVLGADRACKQTGAPDSLIAERLALTIAGRARRLGL